MKKVPCRKCEFWEMPHRQEENGECHRHTPYPVAGGIATVWPKTPPGEWCGEAVEKEAVVALDDAAPLYVIPPNAPILVVRKRTRRWDEQKQVSAKKEVPE